MKRIKLVVMLMLVSLTLMACGSFECDMCHKESSGKKHSVEMEGKGGVVCGDCYEQLKMLNIVK